MPQMQKMSQKATKLLSFDEFKENLKSILTSEASLGQPYLIDLPDFEPICLNLTRYNPSKQEKSQTKPKVASYTKKSRTISKPNKSSMSQKEYEEKHRAWRRSVILSSAGSIRNTKILDKELKQRRALELRAARKMGRW